MVARKLAYDIIALKLQNFTEHHALANNMMMSENTTLQINENECKMIIALSAFFIYSTPI